MKRLSDIDDFDLVLEAFYGKDKRFIECEAAIASIRNVSRSSKYNIPINKYTENKKLESLLCDIFGFKRVLIHWDVSKMMTKSNFTLPTAHIIRGIQAATGFLSFSNKPYDEKHSMTCVMDISQALFEFMTDAEILAVIIHEIGHNFEVNPYAIIQQAIGIAFLVMQTKVILDCFNPNRWKEIANEMQSVSKSAKNIATDPEAQAAMAKAVNQFRIMLVGIHTAMNTTSIALTTNILKPIGLFFINGWDFIVQKIPGAIKISNIAGWIARGVTRWMSTYGSVLTTLKLPEYVIRAPFFQLSTFATYKGEKFADSIAASFGYGVPLSSALEKLQTYYIAPGKDYYKKASPFQKFLYNLGEVNAELLEMLSNAHGSAFQRTGNMLKSLKDSLDDTDMTAEQKAELSKEIKAMELTYQKFMELDPDEKGNLLVAMRSFIYKYFGGNLAFIDWLLPDLKLK